MKYHILAMLAITSAVVLVTGALSIRVHADEGDEERLLRHVVLFKFKEGATAEDIQSVEVAFRALPEKIDAIHDFEWGTDVSVENLNEGLTHCFLVTFRSEEARAEYLPHPGHQAFVDILRPHLERAVVVDYWAAR
jgi:hypothetical protein